MAVATWADGTTRDVSAEISSWTSRDPSVITVSSSGVATAVGFGAARIEARYGPPDSGVWAAIISVTPAGTVAVIGDVREPGQGTLAGVRVFEPVSGRSTLTDNSGNYMLAALAGTHLRFEKDGYEPGELDIAPDGTGYMRMQRIVRITAGETAIVPKLTHFDVAYDVGADRCSPCRLIRIMAPTAGTIRLELAWEPPPGVLLYVWAGGQRLADERKDGYLSANAAVRAGENVVYVGYYRASIIYGSYIKFTLGTRMTE
jgi:hypothetical protein